jgi:hypothetical protein
MRRKGAHENRTGCLPEVQMRGALDWEVPYCLSPDYQIIRALGSPLGERDLILFAGELTVQR